MITCTPSTKLTAFSTLVFVRCWIEFNYNCGAVGITLDGGHTGLSGLPECPVLGRPLPCPGPIQTQASQSPNWPGLLSGPMVLASWPGRWQVEDRARGQGQGPPLTVSEYSCCLKVINEQLIKDDNYQHTRDNSEANSLSIPKPLNISSLSHLFQRCPRCYLALRNHFGSSLL